VIVHLSIPLFAPLAFAVLGLFAPGRLAGRLALAGALVTLGYAVLMVVDFDGSRGGLQYLTDQAWIDELGVRYTLGVDGLNLFLIALTAVIAVAALAWANLRPPGERPRLFFFQFGLAETAVLGAFLAQDLALFVIFFDLMLVPFYFLVGGWGGAGRVAATLKLVIYTLVGSLLMLAAAVATAVLADPGGELSFSLAELARRPLPESTQRWIFLGFALAFLIKMPAFPLHGWMPDAYRAMPLPVLVLFSAVLSKVAAYGFLRVALPLFPDAAVDFQEPLLVLGLASILYGSVMAFTTTETRLIVGYSSLAQLGFILLGVFALRPESAQGAVLQMVNHGLVVAPLFFIIAVLAERAGGSEDLRDMGGLALRGPVLAGLFLIVALATLAIPGSANFAGEFLILLGLFQTKLAIAVIAFAGVALASVYMLRAFIRAMHNRAVPGAEQRDLSGRDALVIAPLVACILAFGLYPQLALEKGERGTAASIRAAQRSAQEPARAATPQPAAQVPTP